MANIFCHKRFACVTIKHITPYKIFPTGERGLHKGHEKNLFVHKTTSKGTKSLTAALPKCSNT